MYTRNAMDDIEGRRVFLPSDLTCIILKFVTVTSSINFFLALFKV